MRRGLLWRWKCGINAAVAPEPPHFARTEQPRGFRFGFRSHRPHAQRAIWLWEPLAWPVVLTVQRHRVRHTASVGDEMREAERQAEVSGDLRSIIRAAEYPDLRHGRALRLRDYVAERMAFDQLLPLEPGQQIAHLRRKMIGRCLCQRVQRERGASVGSRGTPQTKIDPPRCNRFDDAKLLGYLQAGIVRQHDAGRTDADAGGGGCDRADQDLRGRSCLARRIMVFGAPIARVTKRLTMLRQRKALADRTRRRATGDDSRLVKNGQSQHAVFVSLRAQRGNPHVLRPAAPHRSAPAPPEWCRHEQDRAPPPSPPVPPPAPTKPRTIVDAKLR